MFKIKYKKDKDEIHFYKNDLLLKKSPLLNRYFKLIFLTNFQGKNAFAAHLHRDDGPAIEWENGDKEWWLNGHKHRLDGPAVEWANGQVEWWVHGSLQLPTELCTNI